MFEESLKLGEDQAFLISIYPHAKNFAFIEDKLYNYRFTRNNSAMQILRKDSAKKLKQHIEVVSRIFDHWTKCGFCEKYGSELLSWALEFIALDLERDELEADTKSAIASKLFAIIDEYKMSSYLKGMDRMGRSCYGTLEKMMRG